jgi:hypothetical protein
VSWSASPSSSPARVPSRTPDEIVLDRTVDVGATGDEPRRRDRRRRRDGGCGELVRGQRAVDLDGERAGSVVAHGERIGRGPQARPPAVGVPHPPLAVRRNVVEPDGSTVGEGQTATAAAAVDLSALTVDRTLGEIGPHAHLAVDGNGVVGQSDIAHHNSRGYGAAALVDGDVARTAPARHEDGVMTRW